MRASIRGNPHIEWGNTSRYRLNFKTNLSPKKEILRQNLRKGFLPCCLGMTKLPNRFLPPHGGVAILPFLFFPCAFSLLFGGCVRVYKPVYIPTKCQIPKIERPALASPILSENIKALLIYAELLEKDLAFCREGKPL